MRKPIFVLAILCMAIFLLAPTALAVEHYELLPVDVIQYPDRLEIHKVYEMATSVDPANIPRSGFERSGVMYTCTDILREVVIGDETLMHIETETIESETNDIETVLSLLAPTKDAFTEDGFYGVLYLNTTSIKSEISGYGNRSRTVTISRSYPNLSDADTQYIPKTVTENNRTYTLDDIQWRTDNTYNIDDYEIGNRYTANATYSGSATSSYVKGYTVTADYVGEICRTGISIIRYTVIFTGTKPEPESEPEQPVEQEPPAEPEEALPVDSEPEPEPVKTSGFNWLFIILPLFGLAAGAGGAYLYLNKMKERRNDAQNNDYDFTDPYTDNNDGDSGACQ